MAYLETELYVLPLQTLTCLYFCSEKEEEWKEKRKEGKEKEERKGFNI